jgi:hypothetical protein
MLAAGGACSSSEGLFSGGSAAGAGGLAIAGSAGDDADVDAGAPAQTGGASLGGGSGAGSAGRAGGAGPGGSAGKSGGGGSAGKPNGAGGGAGGGSGGAGGGSGGAGGGSGGKASAGAGGTSGAPSAGSANGGAAGAGPSCPASCDSNADCQLVAGVVTCNCQSGFVGDGTTCSRPTSCNELHLARPTLVSGAYTLKPSASAAAFVTYCEMTAQGGGWTLVLNEGPTFVPTSLGFTGSCYSKSCTNLAYSSVPLGSDVMLDMRDGPIVGNNQLARVVITGVKATSRGKTVLALFTTGPNYLEKEDNSNLTVQLGGTKDCVGTLPQDMAALVCTSCDAADATCQAPVIVFGDGDSSCVAPGTYTFAIGAAYSYTSPWTNCAGWPQAPSLGATSYYPQNFRIWVR